MYELYNFPKKPKPKEPSAVPSSLPQHADAQTPDPEYFWEPQTPGGHFIYQDWGLAGDQSIATGSNHTSRASSPALLPQHGSLLSSTGPGPPSSHPIYPFSHPQSGYAPQSHGYQQPGPQSASSGQYPISASSVQSHQSIYSSSASASSSHPSPRYPVTGPSDFSPSLSSSPSASSTFNGTRSHPSSPFSSPSSSFSQGSVSRQNSASFSRVAHALDLRPAAVSPVSAIPAYPLPSSSSKPGRRSPPPPLSSSHLIASASSLYPPASSTPNSANSTKSSSSSSSSSAYSFSSPSSPAPSPSPSPTSYALISSSSPSSISSPVSSSPPSSNSNSPPSSLVVSSNHLYPSPHHPHHPHHMAYANANPHLQHPFYQPQPLPVSAPQQRPHMYNNPPPPPPPPPPRRRPQIEYNPASQAEQQQQQPVPAAEPEPDTGFSFTINARISSVVGFRKFEWQLSVRSEIKKDPRGHWTRRVVCRLAAAGKNEASKIARKVRTALNKKNSNNSNTAPPPPSLPTPPATPRAVASPAGESASNSASATPPIQKGCLSKSTSLSEIHNAFAKKNIGQQKNKNDKSDKNKKKNGKAAKKNQHGPVSSSVATPVSVSPSMKQNQQQQQQQQDFDGMVSSQHESSFETNGPEASADDSDSDGEFYKNGDFSIHPSVSKEDDASGAQSKFIKGTKIKGRQVHDEERVQDSDNQSDDEQEQEDDQVDDEEEEEQEDEEDDEGESLFERIGAERERNRRNRTRNAEIFECEIMIVSVVNDPSSVDEEQGNKPQFSTYSCRASNDAIIDDFVAERLNQLVVGVETRYIRLLHVQQVIAQALLSNNNNNNNNAAGASQHVEDDAPLPANARGKKPKNRRVVQGSSEARQQELQRDAQALKNELELVVQQMKETVTEIIQSTAAAAEQEDVDGNTSSMKFPLSASDSALPAANSFHLADGGSSRNRRLSTVDLEEEYEEYEEMSAFRRSKKGGRDRRHVRRPRREYYEYPISPKAHSSGGGPATPKASLSRQGSAAAPSALKGSRGRIRNPYSDDESHQPVTRQFSDPSVLQEHAFFSSAFPSITPQQPPSPQPQHRHHPQQQQQLQSQQASKSSKSSKKSPASAPTSQNSSNKKQDGPGLKPTTKKTSSTISTYDLQFLQFPSAPSQVEYSPPPSSSRQKSVLGPSPSPYGYSYALESPRAGRSNSAAWSPSDFGNDEDLFATSPSHRHREQEEQDDERYSPQQQGKSRPSGGRPRRNSGGPSSGKAKRR